MEKMRMESVDMTTQNIERIGALFPNCITETMGEDGKPKRAINFELLKQMLSDAVLEGDEAYEFTWVGKKAAIVEANKPIRKTLRPCKEESVNWDSTENLYIEGDNLEVLKLLQESYLGKVKMIYIDPPYNTGKDFVYPDSFMMDSEDYNTGSGYFDAEGNVNYSRENSVGAGKYHSDWCSMMYSRLMLGRNLLTSDGVIFISIDDNEVHNLRKIADEIFGTDNFLAQIAWKRKKEISNDSKNVAIQGEYVLCYGMPDTKLKLEPLSGEYIDKAYKEPDEMFTLGKWRPVPLTVSAGLSGGGYTYTITTPTGTQHTRLWAYPESSYNKLLQENKVYFGKDGNGVPQRVMYLSESKGQPISNYWDNVATNKEGKKDILEIFGENTFDTPKPIGLLEKMMNVVVDENDIVLDFFSGSATTAHAVMHHNIVNKLNCKYIMVQVPEICEDKGTAKKAGFDTICEIGKERIRRAAKNIAEEYPDATFDGGFRVLKLDSSNMKDVYYAPAEYEQGMLSGLESNIKEDRTGLDLLFGCLLEWGLPLSERMTVFQIDGVDVHAYGMDAEEYRSCKDGMVFYENKIQMIDNQSYITHPRVPLLACFADRVPESVIRGIAGMKPLCAVFRDSCFQDSPAKINVTEVFKLLAPDTRVKVI